jgi:hypothetical protein
VATIPDWTGAPPPPRYAEPVAEIVLRVRLVAGDQIDVKYPTRAGADEQQALEQALAILADDEGALHVRHGDRMLVLFSRGVAAVEVGPRGAVL